MSPIHWSTPSRGWLESSVITCLHFPIHNATSTRKIRSAFYFLRRNSLGNFLVPKLCLGARNKCQLPRKGFNSTAQGCPACRATLGNSSYNSHNPEGVAQHTQRWSRRMCNPFRVRPARGFGPRVSRQVGKPWAVESNAFSVNDSTSELTFGCRVSNTRSGLMSVFHHAMSRFPCRLREAELRPRRSQAELGNEE